jgi:hypothetical protein
MSRKNKSPKENPSWKPSIGDIIAFVSAIATITGAYFAYRALQPRGPAPQPILPTSTPIAPTETIQPTQTQIFFNPTAAPKGSLHTIRFVAGPIPAGVEGYNVYYSVDNGAEQKLATMGAKIDETFYPTFSQSIRVWVDIKPGTVLHEELHVDDNSVISSDSADNNGLTYQAP